MELDVARALLGLGETLTPDEVERAFDAKREMVAGRIASAPTEGLLAKYKQSLEEIERAHAAVMAYIRPAPSYLSQTQFGDLPSARPLYTQSDASGAGAQRTEHLLHAGKVLAGRYEIRQRIGVGGMGEVYRAQDRNRQEEIAIKVLLPHLLVHPLARERFLAEAKVASSLSHPDIVNVFDVQREGGNDFITMELLRGQTLRELMQVRKAARRPFTPTEVLEVGKVIGMALNYAHKYTVHRDVKPENVWVEEDGGYKLMDFGIARLLSASQLTATTTAMGTAYYMAPEQLRAAKNVDGRADQYALAVLLYELVAGEVPAGRIKPLHLLNSKFPRGASQAIDRALDPQPGARYPGMGEFVKALGSSGVLMSGLAVRILGGVAAAGVLATGTVLLWPRISGLLPDREAERSQRAQAIHAQSAIDILFKRIESSERDIETQVRDAKSAIERYDGMVRMARNEGDKAEFQGMLEAAQEQFALSTEVRDAAVQCVYQSDALVKVRGQYAVGTAAIREGQMAQAASELVAAQSTLELMLKQPDAIRDTIDARNAHDAMRVKIQAVGKQEQRDVAVYLGASDAIIAEVKQAASECRYTDAKKLYARATAETRRALNKMIDDLVAAYGAFISNALSQNRTGEAATALERAKELEKMKSAGN